MSMPNCDTGQSLVMGTAAWECCPIPAGKSWQDMGPSPAIFYKTVHGNGVYVSTTGSGTAQVSTDGVNWVETSSPNIYRSSLIYGNGMFIGMSQTAFATSLDGVTWTNRTPRPSVSNPGGIAYGNGRFVVVSVSGNQSAYSSDGITWTAGGTLSASQVWDGPVYGNGLFVAIGNNSAVTSPDGLLWTARIVPLGNWNKIAYNNGIFLASKWDSGGASGIITSPDGINWTAPTTWSFNSSGWSGLAADSGLFAMTNNGSKSVVISRDGVNWESYSLPLGNMPTVTAREGRFFITGGLQSLFISTPTPCP